MTLAPEIEAKVRASFACQTLMTRFGAEVLDVGAGEVRIAAPITGEVLQQQGAAHAGLSFALGDTAAGYAALTLMAEDAEVLTAEMKINLLRPALGTRLEAEGRVIKPGRRLVVVEADVFAVNGGKRTHIARLQGTMVPMERP